MLYFINNPDVTKVRKDIIFLLIEISIIIKINLKLNNINKEKLICFFEFENNRKFQLL